MIYDLNKEVVEFLSNRCGEGEFDDVPQEIVNWYMNFKGLEEEYGYLANWKGEYGFMYLLDYSHDGQTDKYELEFAIENGRKDAEVFESLKQLAKSLDENGFTLPLFVGNRTAVCERHEFGIFIPFGASNSDYDKIVEQVEKAA